MSEDQTLLLGFPRAAALGGTRNWPGPAPLGPSSCPHLGAWSSARCWATPSTLGLHHPLQPLALGPGGGRKGANNGGQGRPECYSVPLH